MKKIIYTPAVNRLLRTVARPLASFMPDALKIPVTGVIQVRIPGGQQFKMRCNPTSYVAKRLFWDGMQGFESSMTDLFIALAKQSRVFFDVGANIGYYSLLAAAVNADLRVVSFEPVPSPFLYLQESIALNVFDAVMPVNRAVSDKEGELEFYFSKNPKFVGIVEHHLTSTGSLNKQQATRTDLLEHVKVNTITLDTFKKNHNIPSIDLIKLDTEATEHLVLAGAQHILSKDKPIFFCEVLPGKVEQEIEAAFKQHNYQLFRLEERAVVPVNQLAHTTALSNDHLMVHPDKYAVIAPYLK